jgi:hypothetical protein
MTKLKQVMQSQILNIRKHNDQLRMDIIKSKQDLIEEKKAASSQLARL